MDALTKAFGNSQRSYLASKASVSSLSNELLARGPSGSLTRQSDYSRASEQLRHFSGWVYSSIRPIAQKIAGQPIKVGRVRTSPRGRRHAVDPLIEEVESHPILDALADPNELMVSWSLMYVTVASLELTGRQLWWMPMMDGRRRIFPIPSSWITGFEGKEKFDTFLIRPPNHAGEPIPIPSEDSVYFAYLNPGNPHGCMSPLQACGQAVDSDEQIQASQHAMFRNKLGSTHALIVGKQPDGRRPTLHGDQKRQLIRAMKDIYSGVMNAGEPLILDSLIEDIKRINPNVDEMDYPQSSELTKRRISQSFGTNPIIMGEIEKANRASSLAASQHFAEYTLNPKILLISETLTEWLPSKFGKEKIKVWVSPVVPDDAEMDSKRWAEGLKADAVSKNEYRAFLGLPPTEDKVERNNLLSTVGGMTGAVAILSAVGNGLIGSDQASELLQLFLEIDQPLADRIAVSKTPQIFGVDQLRQAAGLEPLVKPNRIDDLLRTCTNRLMTQHISNALETLGNRKNGKPLKVEPNVDVKPLDVNITVQSTQGPQGPKGDPGERGLPSEVNVTVAKPEAPDRALIHHDDGTVSTVEFGDS